MARKTSSFVFCDGPHCKVSVESADGMAPEGWYKLYGSLEGKYENRLAWEFHNLHCAEKFAKERRAAKGEKRIVSRVKESIAETTDEILEAFKITDEPLSVAEIIALTGSEKSWVYRRINALSESGTIFKVTDSRGRVPAKYRINS